VLGEGRTVDDHVACAAEDAVQPSAGAHELSPAGEGVDFASREANRGKMQLWMTAFTAMAVIAVVIVVSVSVLYHG
jgi:hypothetical protein